MGLKRNARNKLDRQQAIGRFRVKSENGISEAGWQKLYLKDG